MSVVDDLISNVIVREGGYINHPNDRGGPTNWGITQNTLTRWSGSNATADDVKNLSKDVAAKIYKAFYFDGLEDITDAKTLEFLFDYSVNAGNGAAIKAVQNAIGTKADGQWGPNSAKALAAYGDQSKLYWPCICYRFDHFMRIMANDPSQTVFSNGWANRMKEFWQPKHV